MFNRQERNVFYSYFQLARVALGNWVRKLKAAAPASELEFLGLL